MTRKNHFFVIVIFALLPALAVILAAGCTKEIPKAPPPGESAATTPADSEAPKAPAAKEVKKGDVFWANPGDSAPTSVQEAVPLDDPGKGTEGEGLAVPSISPAPAATP